MARVFCDLGKAPLANALVDGADRNAAEESLPLLVHVCDRCLLVQLEAFETPERLFSNYVYFSSFSETWLAHSRAYAYAIRNRLALGEHSLVVEVASNDGYLLQYFREQSIPVLGIEPAANVAEEAVRRGVPTLVRFFGTALADELRAQGRRADLLVGNNVLAHVPQLTDFVAGMARLLADEGVITMEFPHLLRLMRETQFDTIYHEHLSYFSLTTVEKIFAARRLTIFDTEEISTHGGSLRIYACHARSARAKPGPRVAAVKAAEHAARLDNVAGYSEFAERARAVRQRLVDLLQEIRRSGKRIAAYGAPAKGNTLLNYCGIRSDTVEFTVDRSPHKQGKLLPGSHVPIYAPEKIFEARPDYVLILPWNIKDEIITQMAGVRSWGGRFIVPIPNAEVVS